MGESLISRNIVMGIIIVVVLVSGTIVAARMSGEVRDFIDSINFWKDETKEEEAVDLLWDAYDRCRNVPGTDCLCDSGISLKAFPNNVYIENLGDGVLFDPSEKLLPDVGTCITFTSFDSPSFHWNEETFADGSIIQNAKIYYRDNEIRYELDEGVRDSVVSSLKSYFDATKVGLIPQESRALGQMLHLWENYANLNPLDSTVIESDSVKLFRHEDGSLVYLCLVSTGSFVGDEDQDIEHKHDFPSFEFKSCADFLDCDNICSSQKICPVGMEDVDYLGGKGTCCKIPCVLSGDYEIEAKALYEEAINLYGNGMHAESKVKFKEVYENYRSSVYADNSLYYLALLEQNQDWTLLKLKELLREFSELSETEYGDYFYKALEKSDELLNCNAATEEECLVQRESLLEGCYWEPSAFWNFNRLKGIKGTCESCSGVNCLSFYQVAGGNHLPESCEKSSCQDVGEPKCNSPKQGVFEEAWYCRSDTTEKVKCEDLTHLNDPSFCNLQTCVSYDGKNYYTLDDPSGCCEWTGTECVSVGGFGNVDLNSGELSKLMNKLQNERISIDGRSCSCGAYCSQYANWIEEYAKKYNIDPILILAIMIQENSCNYAPTSSAGCKGLMQICSWEICKDEFNLNFLNDLAGKSNVEKNIGCGAYILKNYYGQYKDGVTHKKACFPEYQQRKYVGWEAALRAYNGLGCDDEQTPEVKMQHDAYVDHVMVKYRELQAMV